MSSKACGIVFMKADVAAVERPRLERTPHLRGDVFTSAT
jgi:hypothetical protein